jgi:flagellar motility protein MotE (MotC chaperone)
VRTELVPASVATPAAAVPAGRGGDDPVAGPDILKARRSQIEERERALVQREAVAAAAEKQLGDRVAELTALQSRLQALESGLKERDEANWAGMVKTYEGMRPKDAAAIFNDLDKPVLTEIVDRMKPSKATPVIAAMSPEKARQLTADLAARRTRSTTVPN